MPSQLAHPSPKRKRDPAPPPTALLNTTLRTVSTPPRGSPAPESGADSPRNAVADQLRGMTLTSMAAIPMSPLSPTDDAVRKKPKLDAMRVDSRTWSDTEPAQGKTISWRSGDKLDTVAILPELGAPHEVAETPPASRPRMCPDIASFAQPTAFVSSPAKTASPLHVPAHNASRSQNRSSSQPRPKKKSPSPPPSALTWQDSEITGHLADSATDPDDDGTGLNGIGFKPTPALAYARSQKRRQQLHELKARETREARAKRSERRRRGVGSATSREPTVEREVPVSTMDVSKRTVKFAI